MIRSLLAPFTKTIRPRNVGGFFSPFMYLILIREQGTQKEERGYWGQKRREGTEGNDEKTFLHQTTIIPNPQRYTEQHHN